MVSINGLVLAGGKSVRMGTDKGLIRYHNTPQREHLAELLKPYCTTVFISCKKADQLPAFLNPLPDCFEINTPLNGILSAFQQDPAFAWLSVPVDMPFINDELIQFLLKNRNPAAVATCFLDSTGKKPEPLCTIWEPLAARPLFAYFEKGGDSLREFLTGHFVHLLHVPDPKYLININTREEFLKFSKNLHSG